MELKELLVSLGLDEETVTKIVNGMAENKIYTTTEENADVRLSKSKAQRKELEEELTTAKQLVEELKSKSVNTILFDASSSVLFVTTAISFLANFFLNSIFLSKISFPKAL